jgi:hypothetical protein
MHIEKPFETISSNPPEGEPKSPKTALEPINLFALKPQEEPTSLHLKTKPFRLNLLLEKCPIDSGIGDIIFVQKMAKIFFKTFGEVATITVYGLSDLEMGFLVKESIRKRFPEEVAICRLEEMPLNDPMALIVHAPHLEASYCFNRLNCFENIWHISEYSYLKASSHQDNPSSGEVFVSGLRRGELGVFLPNPPRKELSNSSLEHSHLGFLRDITNNPPFYFGYSRASYPLISFIFACAHHPKNLEAPILDIYIPGNRIKFGDRFSVFYKRLEQQKQPLEEVKVRKIEFFLGGKILVQDPSIPPDQYDLSGRHFSLSISEKQNRIIRIVLPGELSEEEMAFYRDQSESNFTFVTGDQSLSEALDKKCMVEVRDHKEDSILCFQEKAALYGFPTLSKFFKLGRCQPSELNPHFKEIAQMIDDPKLEEEVKGFCQMIEEHHNLETSLIQKVQKWMEKKKSLELSSSSHIEHPPL